MDITKEVNKKRKRCKYLSCKKIVNNNICCDEHQKIINTYEKPDECPICLEPFEKENEKKSIYVPLIPCYHWICKDCIIKSGKNECPICRQSVELTKTEEKKLITKANKIKKEKDRLQLEEDRRIAEQIQREINREMNREERVVIRVQVPIEVNVNEDNLEEMMQIINALTDPIERQLFRHMFQNQMQRIHLFEEDSEDEIEDEMDED